VRERRSGIALPGTPAPHCPDPPALPPALHGPPDQCGSRFVIIPLPIPTEPRSIAIVDVSPVVASVGRLPGCASQGHADSRAQARRDHARWA
jgi:hypothetical protein